MALSPSCRSVLSALAVIVGAECSFTVTVTGAACLVSWVMLSRTVRPIVCDPPPVGVN